MHANECLVKDLNKKAHSGWRRQQNGMLLNWGGKNVVKKTTTFVEAKRLSEGENVQIKETFRLMA